MSQISSSVVTLFIGFLLFVQGALAFEVGYIPADLNHWIYASLPQLQSFTPENPFPLDRPDGSLIEGPQYHSATTVYTVWGYNSLGEVVTGSIIVPFMPNSNYIPGNIIIYDPNANQLGYLPYGPAAVYTEPEDSNPEQHAYYPPSIIDSPKTPPSPVENVLVPIPTPAPFVPHPSSPPIVNGPIASLPTPPPPSDIPEPATVLLASIGALGALKRRWRASEGRLFQ